MNATDWLYSFWGMLLIFLGTALIISSGITAYRNSHKCLQEKLECWEAIQKRISKFQAESISEKSKQSLETAKRNIQDNYLAITARRIYPFPYKVWSFALFLMGLSMLGQGSMIIKYGIDSPSSITILYMTGLYAAILVLMLHFLLPKIENGTIVYNQKVVWILLSIITISWIACLISYLPSVINQPPVSTF